MVQGLGEQALVNLLHCPPEQHVAQLEQFEAFVLGQRRNASEVNSQATDEFTNKIKDELLREQARNKALNRSVETLSAWLNQPRPIRMYPPKLNGTSPHTIVHWLLAVEQCGVAQLIEEDTRIICLTCVAKRQSGHTLR
ncbi:unnamed protein product [Peronospora farinosa]|uniref:Uncharacterized protein n=1 Tax=Peronospora farinosa TaxID=134698 RepID=A0AAV0T6S2_9STRA|nr:unnamed protein product [Peronospora farinosa]